LNDMIDDLLVKQILGETTQQEDAAIRMWLQQSAANQKYADQFKLIWEESKKLEQQSKVDEKEAWMRFQHRVAQQAPVKQINNQRRVFLRMAAAVLLLIAGSWITYLIYNPTAETLTVAATQSILTDTLPDASVVTLNKNSSISYSSSFSGKERRVKLKGEAFFNVTPDKKKPFLIDVEDVTVKVVGTSFNVKNKNGKTEVIVETGIVQVMYKNKVTELKPGEKLLIGEVDSTVTKEKVNDHLYNHYRTREFECDGTPLWKVVEVLNEAYDTNIVIERQVAKQLQLTTTFNNNSLESILDIICQTFNLTVEKQGDRIVLK
jgi:transmembrane sensor